MSEQDIATARLEAVAARERLFGTAQQIQERLSPARMAGEAWDGVRSKGEALAAGAVETAARRPVVTGAAALGLAAFLARKPLARFLSRFGARSNNTDGDSA